MNAATWWDSCGAETSLGIALESDNESDCGGRFRGVRNRHVTCHDSDLSDTKVIDLKGKPHFTGSIYSVFLGPLEHFNFPAYFARKI